MSGAGSVFYSFTLTVGSSQDNSIDAHFTNAVMCMSVVQPEYCLLVQLAFVPISSGMTITAS